MGHGRERREDSRSRARALPASCCEHGTEHGERHHRDDSRAVYAELNETASVCPGHHGEGSFAPQPHPSLSPESTEGEDAEPETHVEEEVSCADNILL